MDFNLLLCISIIQSLYLIYMLNYFVAPIDINPYNWNWKNKVFHHSNDIGTSLVCPFGNLSSYLLTCFILLRFILVSSFNNTLLNNIILKLSICVLILTFILSFMNFNVVLYLLPYFISEIIVIKYILQKY